MSDLEALDLSGLAQFRASDFLAAGAGVSDPAAAVHVDLSLIDFDPKQPRRSFKRESIEELSVSIREHGVLEPVSLRRHPERAGRFVVNRGERRVRAARQAELTTVPAFLDDRADPFAQAAENLHREDMSAMDLALFIAEREKEGISRAEIARRLAKAKSFITEAAALNDAPPELIDAVRERDGERGRADPLPAGVGGAPGARGVTRGAAAPGAGLPRECGGRHRKCARRRIGWLWVPSGDAHACSKRGQDGACRGT